MAITIDYSTFVITIPRADMLLLQSSPIEVRQLDINAFHEILRDLEDDAAGIIFPSTHNYVAPISVGGVDLARVMSILDPYTVTFEDGQYAVNITGGNSNIADKVNINNVGVRTANSAGLPDLEAIRVSAFGGEVHVQNGSPYSGIVYPVGTAGFPVSNISDARDIAAKYFLETIRIIGDFTFDTGDDISFLTVRGQNAALSTFTINPGAVTDGTQIIDASVTGTLDGGTILERCVLSNIDYIDGFIFQCMLNPGTIRLGGTNTAHFLDCYSGVPGTGTPTIDMNGLSNTENTALAMRSYSGGIKLIEKTDTSNVSIDLVSGQVKIDSTCTAGTVVIRGVGIVYDSLGNELSTGTINGGLSLINQTATGVHIDEMWQNSGLDPNNPVTISDNGTTTTKSSTGITQEITDTGISRT